MVTRRRTSQPGGQLASAPLPNRSEQAAELAVGMGDSTFDNPVVDALIGGPENVVGGAASPLGGGALQGLGRAAATASQGLRAGALRGSQAAARLGPQGGTALGALGAAGTMALSGRGGGAGDDGTFDFRAGAGSDAFSGALPAGAAVIPDVQFPDPEDGGGSSSRGAGLSTGAGTGPLSAAQGRAAQQIGQLDSLFEQRKQELRDEYQLAETPEEKARIQFLLGDIEEQRAAGEQVIQEQYDQAIESASEQAATQRAASAERADATQERFQTAAADTSDLMAALNREFGGGLGVTGEGMSELAEQQVAGLSGRAADEAAFDQRMGDLTADDIAFLGESLSAEQGAQQGQLQRQAADLSTQAQIAHDDRVQQRIAQEGAQWRDQLGQLQGRFDQRRFGLQDQQAQLAQVMAQIQAQNARQAASIRASQQARAQELSPRQQFELQQQVDDRQRALERQEQQRQAGQFQQLMGGLPGMVDETGQPIELDPRTALLQDAQTAAALMDAAGSADPFLN